MLILFLKKTGNQNVTFYPGDVANIEISSRTGLPSGMVKQYDTKNKRDEGVLSLYVHDTNYGSEPDFILCSSTEAMAILIKKYFPDIDIEGNNHFINRSCLNDESINIERPSPFKRNNIVVEEKSRSLEDFLGEL